MFNEFADDNSISDSVAFLENCELADCDHSFHAQPRMMAFDVDDKSREAMIINDTVVSIVAGMSKENKQIIKDTLLYATLAANGKDPKGGEDWYKQYKVVLNHCGWGSQQWSARQYRSQDRHLRMEQVALEILRSVIMAAALPGPTQFLMLKVAEDAVSALEKSEKPLRLFESSSNQSSGAKFAIASSAESDDGEVVMAMGAVSFKTQRKVTNVLFWNWNSSSVDISAAEDHVFLNQRQYAQVRSVVERRLAEVAINAIENIKF